MTTKQIEIPPLAALIRHTVEEVGDPLMEHIQERCRPHGYTNEQVRNAVRAMVKATILRMKEDTASHDWRYRKGRNW